MWGVQFSSIMCDCDLWILGSPPERYREYSRQVREEYAKNSNWQYRWGRLRFLQEMLKGTHVFTNPLFEVAFGDLARTNMQSEVKALNAGRGLCLAG